jgi:uncharacterized protein YegL
MDGRQEQSKRQEERAILINFVLDKSGSMEMIRPATVAGFNQFLRDQQREGGSATMTLTLFDTHCRTVVSAMPLAEVRPLNSRSYVPGGGTALYDAIARTMTITDEYVATHKPDQVLFVIMTDGQENASREFDRHSIMEMIEDRQKIADYEFIYLGANQDAYAVGDGLGIRGGRTLDFAASPAAAQATMQRVSWNVRAHRRLGEKKLESHAFFSEELESLGKASWDEHKAERDRDAHSAGGDCSGAPEQELTREPSGAPEHRRIGRRPAGAAGDKQEG